MKDRNMLESITYATIQRAASRLQISTNKWYHKKIDTLVKHGFTPQHSKVLPLKHKNTIYTIIILYC